MTRKLGMKIGTGSSPGGGTWTEVWSYDLFGGGASDDGWNGYTTYARIPLAALSATGGTQIRLTFYGGNTEGAEFSALYVGEGAAGDVADFNATPTQLQMGGSNTITIPPASATTGVTDGAAFVKDGTHDLQISWQYQNAAKDNIWRRTAPDGNHKSGYKNAIDAATVDKSGYTDASASGLFGIAKVELLI